MPSDCLILQIDQPETNSWHKFYVDQQSFFMTANMLKKLAKSLMYRNKVALSPYGSFHLPPEQHMHLAKQTPEVKDDDCLIRYYMARRSDPRLISSIEVGLDSDLVIADLKEEIPFFNLDPDNVGYEVLPSLVVETYRPLPDTVFRHEFDKIMKLKASPKTKMFILLWLNRRLPKFTAIKET